MKRGLKRGEVTCPKYQDLVDRAHNYLPTVYTRFQQSSNLTISLEQDYRQTLLVLLPVADFKLAAIY